MRNTAGSRLRRVLAAVALMAGLPVVAAAAGKDGAKAKKVIRLDEISVEGRIQKPQAFYILPRSSLNYSALDQLESFLPKIKKAVQKDPF